MSIISNDHINGRTETYEDEQRSKKCVEVTMDWLIEEDMTIKGYHYETWDKIRDDRYFQREIPGYESNEKFGIISDSPTIVLVSDENPYKEWYVVLTIEDKFQKTDGSAIERVKNFNYFFEKLTRNSDVCPYIYFFAGPMVAKDIMERKFRQALPDTDKYGNVYKRTFTDKHTPYKDERWNLFYAQVERFTFEQKIAIVKEVVSECYRYYKEKLGQK